MESLRRLVAMEPVELPEFRLDPFQEAVLKNLHLEFFLARCRALITPRFSFLTTGEVEPEETRQLDALLAARRDTLARWRRYVVVNLALYSALLETNSYYLSLNDYLLICRFVAVPDRPEEYVLKLYTIAKRDLRTHYKDKIYLGRDHISTRSLRREHFGLPNLRRDFEEQLAKLEERLTRMVPPDETELYRKEHVADLEETIAELGARVDELVQAFPVGVFTHSPDIATLLEASSRFRDVKHLLIEVEDTLGEMERTLLEEGHPRGARYVTKLRKDATNAVNFVMCKVNGRISNVVNRVDGLAYFQTPAGVER
jgi:hypothetical protein